MNCGNLRLTSNPIFLFFAIPDPSLEVSHVLTHLAHGEWREGSHTHTHTFPYTYSEVKLLIDRVIERFTIQLPSAVRWARPSLKFNRLRQSAYWNSASTLKSPHSNITFKISSLNPFIHTKKKLFD